jgi:hypothetical protein
MFFSIVTEDNISQIENMGFSISIDPKTIIDTTRNNMNSKSLPLQQPVPDLPEVSSPISSLQEPPITVPQPTIPSLQEPPITVQQSTILEPPITVQQPNSPVSLQQPPNSPIEDKIKVGGKVHYRGDVKPSRYWNIDQIGAKYCTISTDDDYQLDTENTIKVVRPDEIYLPNDDFVYSIPMDIPLENIQNLNTNPQQFQQQQQQIDTPSINFAPVIKIINDGNDMSTTATDTLPIPPPTSIMTMPLPPPPPPPLPDLEPLQTNQIDFSIPIIKK